MTLPDCQNHDDKKSRANNKLRTLYQCALALLIYERTNQELFDNKVSQRKLLASSGDKKTLSPEEKAEQLRHPSRLPPLNIPKL